MAIVNRSFSVYIAPGMMPPIVHVSEYDIGRAYTVGILDEQGNMFTIPSGTTASIEGTLNGSVGFTQSATISNNQVSFTLSESMTAYSGKAWCKIKLTQNSQPIQTCAFVLAVDRAGVEAGTVIGASGFEQQIVDAVDDYLDAHPPSGGGGLTDDVKQALLNCFENVAWINDDGQTYYDALYAALYPPADLVSISAVFNQGSAVVYNTSSLDTLKQYLVVTATMTDSTTRTVTDYTLSGTLTVGTSTITVSYGGKTDTFNVTVTQSVLPEAYQEVEYIKSTGTQYIALTDVPSGDLATRSQYSFDIDFQFDEWRSNYATNIVAAFNTDAGSWLGYLNSVTAIGMGGASGNYFSGSATARHSYHFYFENGNGYVRRDDNTIVSRAVSADAQGAPFVLFSAYLASSVDTKFNFIGKIYSFTLYTGETKTHELIPCYRKSDNVIGMYDTVSETFFTNSGTGTFLKGSDV